MQSTNTYEELEKRVLAVVPDVVNAALLADARDALERLDAVERRARAGRVTLVVMGEFSRGKSSLLNALLEEPVEREGPELFPVDSYVSTRVLTSAWWGPQEAVTVTLAAQGDLPAEERQVGRPDLRGYVCEAAVEDGVAAVDADRVTAVSIATSNAKLRDGLVVVDTPGIGGVHRGHTAVALGVLDQADVVLYVTDALQPLLPSELAFIDGVARAVDAEHHPERLLFVVTKADQVADPDAMVRDVRMRVAAVPGLGERCAVVAVSTHHRLLHLAGGEAEDYELSGFEGLEALLWPSVARARLRLRLGPVLAELDVAVQSLLGPVDEALAVLDARNADAAAELAASAEARRAEAVALAEGAAEWPEDLRAALAEVATALRAQATADLAELWRNLRVVYRTDKAYLDDPQLVLDALARRLALLAGHVGAAAAARTAAVREEIAARSGLRFRGSALAALPVPPVPEPIATAAQVVPGRPAVVDDLAGAFEAAVRGARLGAERGGQVGQIAWDQALRAALPGGAGVVTAKGAVEQATGRPLLAPSPGAAVGSLAGGLVGATLAFVAYVKAARDVARAERVAALDQLFAPWEEEQRTFLHEAIQGIVDAYAGVAEAELRSRIEQRRAECDATVAEVTVALGAVGRDSAAAREALSVRRDALMGARRAVAGLVGELQTLLGK
jgi:hypothetical protein